MATKIPGIPDVPSSLPAEQQRFFEAMKIALEIVLGRRGQDGAFVPQSVADGLLSKDGGIVSGNVITPNRPVFQAAPANGPGTNYAVTFSISENTGFAVSPGNNALTVTVAGRYFLHAQQLVSVGAAGTYFAIRRNGTSLVHGYAINQSTYDMECSCIVKLDVGDVIDFYFSGTTNSVCGGNHSSLSAFLIG